MNKVPPTPIIERLCPTMRSMLEAELLVGNSVVECSTGLHGKGSVLALLATPFRVRPTVLPEGVEYREVNDPHWWKAEYFHVPTKHCLACRF